MGHSLCRTPLKGTNFRVPEFDLFAPLFSLVSGEGSGSGSASGRSNHTAKTSDGAQLVAPNGGLLANPLGLHDPASQESEVKNTRCGQVATGG